MNLSSFSIKAKLNALIIIVSVLLIGIGVTGLWGVNSSSSALYNVYNNRLLSISQMNEVRNNQMQIRINLMSARLISDPFDRLAVLDKVTTNIFNVDNLINAYKEKTLAADEKTLFDAFLDARMNLGREAVLPITDQLQADDIEEADRLFEELLTPKYIKASEAIDAVINYHVDFAKQEYERVTHMANIIQTIALASIVIGLLLVIITGYLITSSINKGVSTLAKAANNFSQGHLQARAVINSHDELGQVATVFNKMATDFSNVIEKIRNSTNEVTCASELQSSTADKIESLTREQTEQAMSVAHSVSELNNMVKDIVDKTTEIANAANNASHLAMQGNIAVNDAVNSIQDISRTVHESSELIHTLGKRSDQVGEIVKVIQGIADQTNLLALNAAIEAARAGEQGRGFAVVADEVRNLAKRTSNATAEISEMITAIQNETANAVNAMNRGSTQVSTGVTKANLAGESLKQINDSVKMVSNMIQHIASSTQVESEAAGDITNKIEKIADMARKVSETIGQTSSTCHSIMDMSHHLQEEVAHFKT